MNPTPTTNHLTKATNIIVDDDDITVLTSNVSGAIQDNKKPNQDPHQENVHLIDNNSAQAANMVTKSHAWPPTVALKQVHIRNNAQMAGTTKRATRAVDMAISDSGATAHFLVEGAPAVNITPAKNPLSILLPNGKRIKSTHTCNLDIPWLPAHMTEAHIVPGLSHLSLISTRKFCDAGCRVVFDQSECRVYKDGILVLVGDRDPDTNLWRLPINPATRPERILPAGLDLCLHPHQKRTEYAYNVYTIPHKQNQMKYMHQSFLNAPIPTLLKAIKNDQLRGIPFMKSELIIKYLARSPATSKGRMKRPRAGIRSTRKKGSIGKTPQVETTPP